MAVRVLDTVYVYETQADADAGTNLNGYLQIKIDTEANLGDGAIVLAHNYTASPAYYGYRSFSTNGEEYPYSPFFSTAGKELKVTVEPPTTWAQIAASPVVCDIANLIVDVTPATRDDNGQIAISVDGTKGKKEYSIDNGLTWQASPNFYNLAPGLYDVVAADAARFCTISEQVQVLNQITRPNDVRINDIDITHETGFELGNGTITVDASGTNTPFTYIVWVNEYKGWEQSSNYFVDIPPGTYSVTVIDSENNSVRRDNIIILPFEQSEPQDPVVPQRITELKTIEARDCQYGEEFFISWLNLLGGWDSWLFERKQVFEMESSDIVTFEKGYSDLSTMQGRSNMLKVKSRQVVTVGVEGELRSTCKALAEIMLSEKIYWYRDENNWKDRIEITPMPGSVKYTDTKSQKQSIELSFVLPDYYL